MTVPELSGAPARSPLEFQVPSRSLARVLTRDNFRFSPGGTTAACVAGDAQGGLHLEAWSFAGPSPRWWPLPLAGTVTLRMQPIPLDDGRILFSRERTRTPRGNGEAPDGGSAGAYEIVLLDRIAGREKTWNARRDPDPGNTPDGIVPERVLGAVRSVGLVALRLLPGSGIDRTDLFGLVIGVYCDHSTIWRLAADPPHLERLAEISGALLGGAWLDLAGTFFGVDRVEGDGPIKTVAVDLRDGSWSQLLSVSKVSNDRLLACDTRSGLLVVSTDASGEERLGWGRLGADQPVRFPEALHRPGHEIAYPLTFDPDGQRVLLYVDEGVRAGLAVYTPAKDHLAPVEIPAGYLHGAACWVGGVLRFPFSTPCQPPGVATMTMGNARAWSVAGSAPAPPRARWADAHIEWLDGAAGPIEAIVYGGDNWRTSRHLLVALHGGPVEAWRFTFDPLFQRLDAAGIAVVALNQRGSSRYGAAHTLAIRGAWGGPDLDDVCCIARALDEQRRANGAPGLMLFGVSYGAFLALLAASCEPDLWSRCVVFAPFLSGSRLYQEASPPVQTLIQRLGGLQELCDEVGPRDVLRLCHAIQARLLIVHGERDEMIPVSQSRALRERLLSLGRREGVDFEYLEILDGRHDLILDVHTQALHERLVPFLAGWDLGHHACGRGMGMTESPQDPSSPKDGREVNIHDQEPYG